VIRVSVVVDGSPATGAAIEAGDELVTVDARAVAGKSLAEVREVLRSRVGRQVSLRGRRAGRGERRRIILRRMA
jgi:C-terminal processing protease CtpA/Prc